MVEVSDSVIVIVENNVASEEVEILRRNKSRRDVWGGPMVLAGKMMFLLGRTMMTDRQTYAP